MFCSNNRVMSIARVWEVSCFLARLFDNKNPSRETTKAAAVRKRLGASSMMYNVLLATQKLAQKIQNASSLDRKDDNIRTTIVRFSRAFRYRFSVRKVSKLSRRLKVTHQSNVHSHSPKVAGETCLPSQPPSSSAPGAEQFETVLPK